MYLCRSSSSVANNRSQEPETAAVAAEMPSASNQSVVVVVDGTDAEEDHASGSRTLDKRLNPNAPDFVPSKTARVMAAKRINELLEYTCWSNASEDEVSYGRRYDSIWRESSIQQQQLQLQLTAPQSGDPLSTNLELASNLEAGDAVSAELSLKERSKLTSSDNEIIECGGSKGPSHCCGSCVLM